MVIIPSQYAFYVIFIFKLVNACHNVQTLDRMISNIPVIIHESLFGISFPKKNITRLYNMCIFSNLCPHMAICKYICVRIYVCLSSRRRLYIKAPIDQMPLMKLHKKLFLSFALIGKRESKLT